jgi:uncharacterized protein (DUF1810 family)/uncharacterized protein YegL
MEAQTNTQEITKIYNLIILDESGSMRRIYTQALDGANETIQTIRAAQESADDQKQFLTFVTFDSGNQVPVRTIIDTIPITEVKDLTEADYRPNGSTPLYDAMGQSLTTLERKVQEGDSVLVTVITDGMENSSREYSGNMVKEMVSRLRAKGWTFVYIGANQDAARVAKSLDIENAMNFCANEEDTRRMWRDYHHSKDMYYEKVRMSKMRGERVFEDKEFFGAGAQGDIYNLERFRQAQEGMYQQALDEIRNGQKRTHWIWFIFPQIHGLGRSGMSRLYAISCADEARAYLADPVLGMRLREISHELLRHAGTRIEDIMGGGLDAMKLWSSMTLFDAVCPHNVFDEVLRVFFDGNRDHRTLMRM